MMRNSIEHIKELIEEIDILIELLGEPIEEDPKENPVNSKLINKEYEELSVYNSKATFERVQKGFLLVGKECYQTMSDNMLYVNHKGIICESGDPVGNECEIRGRGLKVLGELGLEGKDIVLVFKKSKKIKKDFEDGA